MKYLFLVLGLLVLGACSSLSNMSSDNKVSLEHTQWILDDAHLGETNEITLRIEEGKISGNASCNNYFGGVVVDFSTGSFSVGNLGVTRKMCHKMTAEQYFLNVLEKVNKYKIHHSVLELYQDNVLLLKFKKN